MGPDLSKLSDDELFNRLGLIQSRIGYAQSSQNGAQLMQQLMSMQEQVNFHIQDRIQRLDMEQKLSERPDVVNLDGPVEKKKTDNSNSRAKSKSDIINRLRRTSTPSNIKDA